MTFDPERDGVFFDPERLEDEVSAYPGSSTRSDAQAGHTFGLSDLRDGSTADAMFREGWRPDPVSGGYQFLRPPARARFKRGNPGYYTGGDDPKFIAALKTAAHDAVRAGARVNLTTLAKHGLVCDPRTVKRYVSEYDLAAIEEEAARCTTRANTCRFDVVRAAEFKLKRQ